MEGLSHQRLLRRQLSESLDLNEALAARIEQLKAYIWRAGLEVPRPEDGEHGPIIEREDAPLHAPVKRLRTEGPRAEPSDGISLAAIEASLDRSVRDALARARSDESRNAEHSHSISQQYSRPVAEHASSPPPQPVNQRYYERDARRDDTVSDAAPHSASERSARPEAEASAPFRPQDPSGQVGQTGMLSDELGTSTPVRPEPLLAHEPASYRSVNATQSILHSSSSMVGAAQRQDQANTSIPGQANTSMAAQADRSIVQPRESLTTSSIAAQQLGQADSSGAAQSQIQANNSTPYGGQVDSLRASPDKLRAHNNWHSIESHSTSRASNSSAAVLTSYEPPEETNTVNDALDEPNPTTDISSRRDDAYAGREHSSEESAPQDMDVRHVSVHEEVSSCKDGDEEGERDEFSRASLSNDGVDAHAALNSNERQGISSFVEASVRREHHGNSPRDVEPSVQEPSSPYKQAFQEPDVDSSLEKKSLRTAQLERSRATEQLSVPRSSSPSQQAEATHSSYDKHEPSAAAEHEGNDSVPLVSRPLAVPVPVAPASEPRIPRRERSEIRREVPPLPSLPTRKPRDEWAMQFRESFNSRKAQNALQRAGVPPNSDLAESMQRLADSEERGNGSRENPEENASSRSTPNRSEKRRSPAISELASGSPVDANKSAIRTAGQARASDSNVSFSDVTITPARASRGLSNGRFSSLSPPSIDQNANRTGSAPSRESAVSPVEAPAKFVPPQGSPPAPRRRISTTPLAQHDAPPMPPVPQSILRRLSRPPSSIIESGLVSQNDSLSSPFKGSVRPPMTSTPGPKSVAVQRAESTNSPARETHGRSPSRSKDSPNSSIYQSAMQSFDTGQSIKLRESASSQRPSEREPWQSVAGGVSTHAQHQKPEFTRPLQQAARPSDERSADPYARLKPQGRQWPESTTSSHNAGEEVYPESLRSSAQSRQAQSAGNSSQVEDRRVSFKLPSSNASQDSAESQPPRAQGRRKLVRNVYPVDLSNTSQPSLPDMSMQAAADAGDISERRERPPL